MRNYESWLNQNGVHRLTKTLFRVALNTHQQSAWVGCYYHCKLISFCQYKPWLPHTFSHLSSDLKLLPFPLQPPNINFSQRPVLELQKNLLKLALQGPVSLGSSHISKINLSQIYIQTNVNPSRSFPHSLLITGFVTRLTTTGATNWYFS